MPNQLAAQAEKVFTQYADELPEKVRQAVEAVQELTGIVNDFADHLKDVGVSISLHAELDGACTDILMKLSDRATFGHRVRVAARPGTGVIEVSVFKFFNQGCSKVSNLSGGVNPYDLDRDPYMSDYKLDDLEGVAKRILQVARDHYISTSDMTKKAATAMVAKM